MGSSLLKSDVRRAAQPETTASVVVRSGQTAQVTSHVDQTSVLSAEVRLTDSIDEFRDWFTIPGDRFRAGLDVVPKTFLPSGPWTGGTEFDPAELSEHELDQLRLAANCYLFGDRSDVGEFRAALERYYAPFSAAFYAADLIRVEPSATLVITGHPAVLSLRDLEVLRGGRVLIQTPTCLRVDTITVVEESRSPMSKEQD